MRNSDRNGRRKVTINRIIIGLIAAATTATACSSSASDRSSPSINDVTTSIDVIGSTSSMPLYSTDPSLVSPNPGQSALDGSTSSSPSSTPATAAIPVATAETTATVVLRAVVTPTSGTVLVAAPDASPSAAVGAATVASGSTIRVQEAGGADLAIGDGAIARLGADSTVVYRSTGPDAATIELATGTVWLTSSVAATTVLTLDVPGAAALIGGARVLAGCAADECFIGAIGGPIGGAISVVDAAGATSTVASGTYVKTSPGSVSAPVAFPPSALGVNPFAVQNISLDIAAGITPVAADGSPADATTARIDGDFTVTYRTTESDRDDLDGSTVDRHVSIRTQCEGLTCAVIFSTELKAPDGSITTLDTPLDFDGTAYHGALSSTYQCQNHRTGATAADALTYTSTLSLTVTGASYGLGVPVVTTFAAVLDERNEVSDEGRAIKCNINLRNDGYSSHAVTAGAGVRA